MTTKEIAETTGKTEWSVQRWAKKLATKYSKISDSRTFVKILKNRQKKILLSFS
jgi:hypothetical protein